MPGYYVQFIKQLDDNDVRRWVRWVLRIMMMMMMVMMMMMMMVPRLDCHMLYKDGSVLAAVSHCISGHLMGFISTDTDTFEISPLTPRLRSVLADTGAGDIRRK